MRPTEQRVDEGGLSNICGAQHVNVAALAFTLDVGGERREARASQRRDLQEANRIEQKA